MIKELGEIGIKKPEEILGILTNRKKLEETADTEKIDRLLSLLPKERVVFNPSLARGLAYYTGIVFEGFLKSAEITSSICGGGRYDNLVGLYGSKDFPAVGISFGVEPITEFLKLRRKEEKKTLTKAYVIPIKTFEESLKVAQKLRSEGINTEIDLMGRGISKNLDYANSLGIPYVIFLGPSELERNVVKLRDMASGKEKELPVEKVIKFLR